MELEKYYLLYSDNNQTKLLTTAKNLDVLKDETEYYTCGVWFEYDQKVGSNFLFNEKQMKGIVFPEKNKQREVKEIGGKSGSSFKWVV